jgi:hypothetical protein
MKPSTRVAGAIVIIASLAIASFYLFLVPGMDTIVGIAIPFEEIDSKGGGGITERVEYLISDNETWNSLWNDLHATRSSVPPLPIVNFSAEMVIAVFQGERPTGGYVTTITRIIQTTTSFEVFVDEEHPGPGSIVTMAFTQPHHIVRIPAPSLNLSFHFNYNIFNRTLSIYHQKSSTSEAGFLTPTQREP